MGFYDSVKKETLDPLGNTNDGFANGTATGPTVATQPPGGAPSGVPQPQASDTNPVAGGNTGDPQEVTTGGKQVAQPNASTVGNSGAPNTGGPLPTDNTINDRTTPPPNNTTPGTTTGGQPIQIAMPGPGSGPAPSAGGVDTVEARMARMLGENSPLLERARTLGIQTANARGVPVSSMADQAIEEAMVNSVRPIAEADANATNQVNIAREQMANQASIAAADSAARVAVANAGLAQAHEQMMAQIEMTKQGWAHDDAMGAQNFERNMQMFNLQLGASRTDADTARTFATQQQYFNSILAINTDPNMSPEQKAAQINVIGSLYAGQPYTGPNLRLVTGSAPTTTNTTGGPGAGRPSDNNTNSG